MTDKILKKAAEIDVHLKLVAEKKSWYVTAVLHFI